MKKVVYYALRHEGFLICLSLLGFLVFPWVSRRIDVTSAPVDPGVLSIVITAVLSFLIFKAATWAVIKVIWPAFAEYSETEFEQDFNGLSPLFRVIIYLSFYLLLLWAMVITMGGL